jgi:hypothetical protein
MDVVGGLAWPRNLAAAAERDVREAWLATILPAIIRAPERMWSVRAGEPFQPGGREPGGRSS